MNSLQRLKNVVRKKIGRKAFIIASHSEPVIHYYEGNKLLSRPTTGGLVTAMDPVMQACGGTWVAYAAGNADMDVTRPDNTIGLPLNRPRYRLKRIPIPKNDLDAYLDHAANSSIWPWCHFAYVRPEFNDADWHEYRKVNKQFADSILQTIRKKPAFVWIQDYQLALAARYIKEKRPDVNTAQFWHIPWPNVEIFKICPWGHEILESLLHNDLLGFHIRYYANNFLDSVDQTLQARVDRDQSSIYYKNSRTQVKEFPISVDFRRIRNATRRITPEHMVHVRQKLGLTDEKIVLGIDRLDYSKGIPEKLRALDLFLKNNPHWRGKMTLIQAASPSRTQVPAYIENAHKTESLVDEINYRWSIRNWKPIAYLTSFIPCPDVLTLYKMANTCLVTPLHDGMNLVTKEYVAAKEDGNGTLILSRFTGAARELTSALDVNPYNIAETASAIKKALQMPLSERKERMAKASREVQDHDVYTWAADFIQHIGKLESTVV